MNGQSSIAEDDVRDPSRRFAIRFLEANAEAPPDTDPSTVGLSVGPANAPPLAKSREHPSGRQTRHNELSVQTQTMRGNRFRMSTMTRPTRATMDWTTEIVFVASPIVIPKDSFTIQNPAWLA
jgi:hypothetical protein